MSWADPAWCSTYLSAYIQDLKLPHQAIHPA
ncbi:unnamed protein product [Fusarium venenatum]|uniref:Uncharacterized protein n=1 Tax=Fusarium venenatum TaxID=56646 RepID=A0A2L2TMA4_9HYPO|nr:uncharacterized protein FVRRES_00898 [Fusarium venenatum]CEI64386.1 unnamed protein product [Fusarium venenatum]